MEVEGVILRRFIFNIPKIRNMIKFYHSESIFSLLSFIVCDKNWIKKIEKQTDKVPYFTDYKSLFSS